MSYMTSNSPKPENFDTAKFIELLHKIADEKATSNPGDSMTFTLAAFYLKNLQAVNTLLSDTLKQLEAHHDQDHKNHKAYIEDIVAKLFTEAKRYGEFDRSDFNLAKLALEDHADRITRELQQRERDRLGL